MRHRTTGRPAALLAATLAVSVPIVAAGCRGEAEPQRQAAQRSELGEPSAVYITRGRVVSLPDPAQPTSEFQVRHEAIDTFVDSSGEMVGMSAMVMPFPLAQGVSVADLSVGDVVEVEFAVWWRPRRHWEATRITKLPPDTELQFREARPPLPPHPPRPSEPPAAETDGPTAVGG